MVEKAEGAGGRELFSGCWRLWEWSLFCGIFICNNLYYIYDGNQFLVKLKVLSSLGFHQHRHASLFFLWICD